MRVLNSLREILIVASAAILCAAPAQGEWRRAESTNFIVYSQGSEASLRSQTRTLELFDYILRARMGLAIDELPYRKLPIYLVGGRAGLRDISPDAKSDTKGFYLRADEDIFAVAIRDQEMDFLLHEYYHHFSFQTTSASNLPGWLIEGLAEYFMTAEVRGNTLRIGDFNRNRIDWLMQSSWIPLDQLLSKRYAELSRSAYRDTYYPVAWLLTHWFMSDDTRRGRLLAYVAAVNRGADPVAAVQDATGMDLSALLRALRNYLKGSLRIAVYQMDRPEPEITVTTLPASADDLLLLGQRLKLSMSDENRDAAAALVRQKAALHPDDPFAQLLLGHAELHFGDPLKGEALLARLLERDPANVEALQLLAGRQLILSWEEGEDRTLRLREAQSYLRRAYAADPEQYNTLYLLAQVRAGAEGYPTENDLLTWRLACDRAPQLPEIRLGFASALMKAARSDEAIALLMPLANAPHGGNEADAAQALLERAKAGQAPLTQEEIDATQDAVGGPAKQEPEDPSSAPAPEDDDADEAAPAPSVSRTAP